MSKNKHAPAGPTEEIPEDKALDAQKAPVVAAPKAPAVHEQPYDPNIWGQAQLTSRDVIIPRILMMQPMSPQVTDGKAVFGQFVESLNEEVLGQMEKGFNVVPFWMEKVFVEFKLSAPKTPGAKPEKEWLRTYPITPENETLPYEGEMTDEKTGEVINVMRDRVMNFYVLLEKELEQGGAIPYIVSFRKTSLTAGKKLTTQMYMKNINAGKTPASMIMEIFAKKEQSTINGQTVTYGVADVRPKGQTPTEYIAEAFRWLQLVKDGKAKVHEESYAKEGGDPEFTTGPAPTEGTGRF